MMDTDMNMDSDTTTQMELPQVNLQQPLTQDVPSSQAQAQSDPTGTSFNAGTSSRHLFQSAGVLRHGTTSSHPGALALPQPGREPPRDISVKVHIRRPEKDNWAYLGRAVVSQEVVGGKSTRLVVRSLTSHKILATFGETSALQAEKRGNFVVVGCVEGSRVVSWSLNALNNSETIRLLATIELCCASVKHFGSDPTLQHNYRRRIARLIRDDRKKRHRRRKDQEAMIAAFEKTGLSDDQPMQMQTS